MKVLISENVALNKACSMSSVWHSDHPAKYAVNGNTSGIYNGRNCIQSGRDDYSSSWAVNLGTRYPVYDITIWARESDTYANHIRKMANCTVLVDNEVCYTFPTNTTNFPRRIDINCKNGVINGSVVKVAKNVSRGIQTDLDKYYVLSFCEVQVWSCSDGYWGSGCDQVCGECRDGAPCDKVTGHCPAGCVDGRYGEKCDKNCSVNCAGACDQNTGNCHSCRQPGVQLPLCSTDCPDGTFGQTCSKRCSENCADVCHKVNGQCTCKPGWKPVDCTNKCDVETYGIDCFGNCGSCVGITCYHVNGSCDQCAGNFALPLCKECLDGYYGQSCYQICSVNCSTIPCDKVSGYCTCKPGLKPPHCSDECDDGQYGQHCSQTCSANCETSPCNTVSGNCSCKPGWMAPDCKVAIPEGTSVGDKPANTGDGTPLIAGSAAGGVVVLVLVVVLLVFLIRRRSHKGEPDNARVVKNSDVTSDQPNHVYQNVPERGQMRPSDTTEETAMPQDTTGDYEDVGNGASTYDKLEIYENKKDITNVYTDLKTVQ